MEPPASPDAAARRKFSGWHLPAILLIALALRLTYLGWAQGHGLGYQTDCVEAYEVAAKYEAGDERAQYIGQPNCNASSKLPGPAWTLFCVAGLKLSGSPQGIILLIILANLAAIALIWRLAQDVAGRTAANFAALFMAVSLWAVQYSSIIWNPSPMPLFGAVIFLALFRCLRKPKSRVIFWIPFLLLVGAQFHMSTLSLILPLILFCWVTRLRPNWGWLATGLIAALVCYIPYILGDLRHDWANTRGMLTGGSDGFSPDALKIFSSPFSFFVTVWNPGWTYAPGQYAALLRSAFGGSAGMNVINIISGGFTACIVLGVIQATRLAMKNRTLALRATLAGPPSLLTVLFLFLAYLASGLVAGKPFHARYCMLVLPLIFILAGGGAAQCLQSPRLKILFLPMLLITMAADLWLMPVICRFEGDRIANGPTFVPSFAKMDLVYHQLKSRAPGLVEVRDADYIAAIPPGDKNNYLRHARVFSHYVHARELELLAAGQVFTRTNVFALRAVSAVSTNDPAIAFYGNGIALVAVPETTQH
ncbi:MAG: glycosyltransferase family 39 protein [Verrucomicrobia bacterium]|nr:glycosyltransferase family 39 protein [Verrucomicrobiota bacterium]